MGERMARRRWVIVAAALSLVTVAVFLPMLGHDFVGYDDNEYVTENHRVRAGISFDGIKWAFTTFHFTNWHPLTWISHMLDVQLYGLSPSGHLATNLLLHLANALLLFHVLWRMTGALWRSGVVAAFFAVHPSHVESVAWVAERKDVLSTLFWMLTLLLFLRAVERPSTGRRVLVAAALATGLAAKPMLVTVPLVLLILDFWPLNRVAPGRRWLASFLLEKIPLLLISAAAAVATVFAQYWGGTVASFEIFPIGLRLANALVSYVRYLEKMVCPARLAVFYPLIGAPLPWWRVAGAALLLAVISVAVIRNRGGRPYLLAGWLWYLITLLPVIGLVQVGEQAMADRYTYVPLIGPFLALVWLVGDFAGRLRRAVPALAAGGVAVIVALAGLARTQVGVWRDGVTLFEHATSVTEGNYLAHLNLGVALEKRGRLDEALEHHREALRLKPGDPHILAATGFDLYRMGKLAESVPYLLSSLAAKPGNAEAQNNLGVVYARQGLTREAVPRFRQAISVVPDYATAHLNLADALAGGGDCAAALPHYLRALNLGVETPLLHYNIGVCLESLGRPDEAAARYREALRLKPDFAEARDNLAVLLGRRGRR